jgi:hypothetical protein
VLTWSFASPSPLTVLDFPATLPMLRPRRTGEDTLMMPALIGLLFASFCLALTVLVIAGIWKTFVKAGQPGWAVLIPLYNIYVLLRAAGKPGWWLLLMFIPIVGLVVWIMAIMALAQLFGKGGGFALGLILLPYIFYPILGFGDAQYSPPIAVATA